jgi:peptidoglycan/xylan/chitin deacetylase (PgdA/CDA1 family)
VFRLVVMSLLLLCSTVANGSTFDVAVTFDDLPAATAPKESLQRQREITRRITATLRRRKIPVVGFVNGSKLLVSGRIERSRLDLLRMWLAAGAELGNHTFAHLDLHRIDLAAFEQEVIRGEDGLRDVVQRSGRQLHWFRHPFLHTGLSAEVRTSNESFLNERGYQVAPVTIDNADWIFAKAYDAARIRSDRELMQRIRTDYVRYMIAKTNYYRAQARQLFGREIAQVLLVHANGINADAFDDLAAALIGEGARFVTLSTAVADDAYRSVDTYYGHAGISWIHRWALSAGKRKEFFAGEPAAPEYILQLANVSSE